jgi:hypothetical protein
LQSVNRIGGVAMGLGKGAALAALIVFFFASASWMPHRAREQIQDSYLVPPLSQLAEGMIRLGKEKLFPKDSSQAQPNFRFAL